MREFLGCVNCVSLYHMYHALPLRVDAYNNLVNHNSALKDRGHVLMIESIPPVAAGSGCDV